jgi:hypothetical protein
MPEPLTLPDAPVVAVVPVAPVVAVVPQPLSPVVEEPVAVVVPGCDCMVPPLTWLPMVEPVVGWLAVPCIVGSWSLVVVPVEPVWARAGMASSMALPSRSVFSIVSLLIAVGLVTRAPASRMLPRLGDRTKRSETAFRRPSRCRGGPTLLVGGPAAQIRTRR